MCPRSTGVDLGRSPAASSFIARRTMEANRRVDTTPEKALRAVLHARGLRFRKDHRVETAEGIVRPDIVFTRTRVAVFVDGCFWHRCPEHGQAPRANGEWWREKLDRNVARDRRNDRALTAEGWAVVRVWEHENPNLRAAEVERIVRQRATRLLGQGA